MLKTFKSFLYDFADAAVSIPMQTVGSHVQGGGDEGIDKVVRPRIRPSYVYSFNVAGLGAQLCKNCLKSIQNDCCWPAKFLTLDLQVFLLHELSVEPTKVLMKLAIKVEDGWKVLGMISVSAFEET